MRALKKNKGTFAYLVFVVGFVAISLPAFAVKAPASDGKKDEAPATLPSKNITPEPTKGPEVVPPGELKEPPKMPPAPALPQINGAPMPNGENAPKSPPPGMGENLKPGAPKMPPPPPPGANALTPPPSEMNPPQFPPPGMGENPNPNAPKMPPQGMPARRVGNGRPAGMDDAFGKPNGRPTGNGRAAPGRGPAKSGMPTEEEVFHVVPQKCVPAKGQFIWNFEEEELVNILRQVSDLLCRTIVINDTVGKNLKMTIIGKSALSPKDAWDVLQASLSAKGFALIEQGKTWTVVKKADQKSYATPMYANGKQAANNEAIGTLFYKSQHASLDVLKNVSRSLISKEGLVETIGDQFIIVIDSNSNIRRLGNIFAQVDIEDAVNRIHIITLHNADSKTVEKQVRDLFDIAAGANRRKSRRTASAEDKSVLDIQKIIADERTNSLIVIADKESVDKLKEVIALIDVAATDQSSKGKIHVKKLKFADAKKIAETLSNVVQQGKGSRYNRRREDAAGELFEGEVRITAHENTNTLVTVASANDYRSLLATINKLDVRKEQVYVEAVILDIEVKDNAKFGIDLFSGMPGIPGIGGGSLGFMANPGGRAIAEGLKSSVVSSALGANTDVFGPNSIGALAVLGNFLTGGVAGIVGPTIPGTKIPSFGAVLTALSENSNVDVLSTPYLLTTDNQEAVMSVGDKVPVLKGASSLGGVAGGLGGIPMQNVEREDVKLTFKVTPHVGADDNVRLEIDQEVNELGAKMTILNQEQYSIRTKSAKTTLVLRDQQTGVIGGLIHHSSIKNDNKIPFLGDIPIVGWLFKNRKTQNDRRSLLLIITPYIIRTDDDYRKILERKMKEREEFSRLYYGGKIKNYNPYIEYDKKAGPLSSMLLSIDQEMNKTENGGVGDGSEVIIAPKSSSEVKVETREITPANEKSAIPTDETVYLDENQNAQGLEGEESFPFGEFAAPESSAPNVGVAE